MNVFVFSFVWPLPSACWETLEPALALNSCVLVEKEWKSLFNLVLWRFTGWHVILCAEDSYTGWDVRVKYISNYGAFTAVNERKWFISGSRFSVSCWRCLITLSSLQHAVKISLKCVWGIGFYGKLKLWLCSNAAESGYRFENPLLVYSRTLSQYPRSLKLGTQRKDFNAASDKFRQFSKAHFPLKAHLKNSYLWSARVLKRSKQLLHVH